MAAPPGYNAGLKNWSQTIEILGGIRARSMLDCAPYGPGRARTEWSPVATVCAVRSRGPGLLKFLPRSRLSKFE